MFMVWRLSCVNESEKTSPVEEPFRYGWFDGILQGSQEGESQVLWTVVGDLNRIGLTTFSLDIDGGRFSILAEDQTVSGEALSKERVERFFQILKVFPSLLKNPHSIESTLRATFVTEKEVVETLFAPIQSEFQSLSKRRGISESDRARDPSARLLPPVSRRAILGGIVLGFFVMAWILFGAYQKGMLGRIFSPKVNAIKVDMGPLKGFLRSKITKRWGIYQVELERGPKYPKTVKEFVPLLQEAKDSMTRAFFLRLQDGGRVWVFLLTEKGRVLESKELSLAPLLQGDRVKVKIPGRMWAKTMRLSLYPPDQGK